jgi:hypothetical protein
MATRAELTAAIQANKNKLAAIQAQWDKNKVTPSSVEGKQLTAETQATYDEIQAQTEELYSLPLVDKADATASTATTSPVREGNVVTTPLTDAGQGKLDKAISANEQFASGNSLQAQADSRVLAAEPAPSSNGVNLFAQDVANYQANVKPLANPLHQYATYTYGLTLFMLAKEEYETLQKTPADQVSSWAPKFALISSAGRYNKAADNVNTGRHYEFHDDFYFENFRMTTVIGLNNQNRGTNAIEMSFTIIEPYGMTLLDRLINASKSSVIGSKNYLAQPYLIELDFFGSDDLGSIHAPLTEHRKRFPIQLIEFKIKASSKGAEYSVKAVPFNHGAFKDTAVTTPVNLEIEATTIGNFFKGEAPANVGATQASRVDKNRQEKAAQEEATQNDDVSIRRGNAKAGEPQVDTTTPYTVANYNNALNEWFALLVKNKDVAELDKVSFSFDDFPIKILESSINPPETPHSKAVFGARSNAAKDNSGNYVVAPGNGRTFGIHAGTRIIDVINQVMSNSDYIAKQMVDDGGNRKKFPENKWVDFYKIIPQITELRYDTIRKRYATTTVYHVVYHRYHNSKHPAMPYANPTAAVKDYNYIYTGKNIDIIDFAIDFDVAYFTATVGLPKNSAAGNNKDTKGNEDEADYVVLDDSDESENPNAMPLEVTSSGDSQSTGRVSTQKQAVVANALASIYSNARGDMINLKLKIIGDPHFIKQDDLYTNPGQPGYNSKTTNGIGVNTNGSIAMDHSEIFCNVKFMTPTDMDESTGGITKNTKYATSKFTGFYKILTVDSEFSKGQFVQTLTGVRMMKTKTIKGTSKVERAESDYISADAATPTGVRPANIAPKSATDPLQAAAASVSGSAMMKPTGVPGVGDYKGVVSQATLNSVNNKTLLPIQPPTPAKTPAAIAADESNNLKAIRRGAGFR